MGTFFKSKAFIVLLTLLIILCGVPAILTAMGQGNAVRDGVMAVVTPAMRGARALGDAFSGFGEYFTEFDRLKAENKALAERVRELETQVYNAELLEEENAWMRAYLGAKRAHTDFVFCDANLIGSETDTYISSFTLDRGSTSGVAVGMPVLQDDGVVGRVTEVGLTFCRVSTIINYDSSIGAYIERSGEVGIVSGDFSRRRDGLCLLEYLPFDADLEVGDKVFSSGLGSVYPRDLYIGEITEITGDPYNHTKIAVVKPAADLSDITKVMILTDYTVYTEED
ncbi:MAG: rod shape-determining protein MreC [Clostridia bacterium]|nr:rod shape-determining protein MreC [Clostridia bacterium]